VKLSRTTAALALAAFISACTSVPSQPVVERLDQNTATTLTALRKPVELAAESLHNAGGDPFAYFAPFETNRAGTRTQYLWLSAPSVENAKVEPTLLCDGQPLTLTPSDSDMSHLGLSKPPYDLPAPWSLQWYYQLTPETLKCLADAQRVTIDSKADNGKSDQFSVGAKGLIPVKEFQAH
jgi:hypothetical protein